MWVNTLGGNKVVLNFDVDATSKLGIWMIVWVCKMMSGMLLSEGDGVTNR